MELSEDVRSYLESVSFAILCIQLDLGHGPEAVVVVKSSLDLLESLREASAPVAAGWLVEATDAGPVVCLAVRAEAAGAGDLLGELYFDAASPGDRETLGLLSHQGSVRAVFLDEDGDVVWTSVLPWDEVRRLETEQVADRAEELLERCDECNFEAAKALFQDRWPLDRLTARAFPEV